MECVTKGHKKPKKNQKKRKYINLNNALTLYVNVLKWREASSQNKIVNNPRSDKKKNTCILRVLNMVYIYIVIDL